MKITTKDNFTLITGACGGLGRAFVEACAENGENLLLSGTNINRLMELNQIVNKRYPNIITKIFKCDLANKDEREKFLNFILENNVNVNRLINNAGVIIEGDMEKFSDEDIENAIMVNCVGTVDLTKKILRIRDKSEKTEILTISSLASNYAIPHMAVYSATKAFLTSIMLALSYEYKNHNVVFSTVCPSGMNTTKEMKESIKSMGIGGKLSAVKIDKVVKCSLIGLKKRKKIIIPGGFNKLLNLASKPFSKSFLAKQTGKIYKKSQLKRKI